MCCSVVCALVGTVNFDRLSKTFSVYFWGGVSGFVGNEPERCLPRCTVGRRVPALSALWPPCRAASIYFVFCPPPASRLRFIGCPSWCLGRSFLCAKGEAIQHMAGHRPLPKIEAK